MPELEDRYDSSSSDDKSDDEDELLVTGIDRESDSDDETDNEQWRSTEAMFHIVDRNIIGIVIAEPRH